ncbi:MAG: phospholipid/cholesterol/gamma-HCH transport system ATP-binding protein [Planctomycetota bacterium]|jgi:phospholipid/cholesterol/gamma-HCH transport system ATP-binding protein
MSKALSSRLRFDGACFAARETHDTALLDVQLVVEPGELVLIELDRRTPRLPLLDAALGLEEPTQGEVLIEGKSWRDHSPAEAAKARSRIGCVFDRAEWVANLELDKNILLAGQHHRRGLGETLREEATAWGVRFGLESLPEARPHDLPEHVLRRAACVRAFLGAPRLIFLENPTRGIYPNLVEPLLRAVEEARAGSAGVVWTTASRPVIDQIEPVADQVFHALDSTLVPKRLPTTDAP